MSKDLFGFEIEKKWDYENAFYLTSNSTRFAKILAHYELYKSIINLPGQIVECGVFKGISLIRYAAYREILENTYSREIIGFDAFGNFPQETSKKDKSFPKHHDSIAGKGIDIDELYKVLQYKNIENIKLVKGDIINTVPKYISKHPGGNIITKGINILDLVLQTKLASSKGEVRRMIKNNGLKINNELVNDETKIFNQDNFDKDNSMKVSHGKKQHVIVKIT